MAAAIARHDELIAGVVEAHGGWFMQSTGEGDSTVSVFESPSDAVRTAGIRDGTSCGTCARCG